MPHLFHTLLFVSLCICLVILCLLICLSCIFSLSMNMLMFLNSLLMINLLSCISFLLITYILCLFLIWKRCFLNRPDPTSTPKPPSLPRGLKQAHSTPNPYPGRGFGKLRDVMLCVSPHLLRACNSCLYRSLLIKPYPFLIIYLLVVPIYHSLPSVKSKPDKITKVFHFVQFYAVSIFQPPLRRRLLASCYFGAISNL